MLKLRPVVLDIEGFRHKKSGFIIKELSVRSHNCSDTVSSLYPSSFKILPQVNKSLTGFKISSWCGLGEQRLPLLLFAANYSKHQTSFSVCRILGKGTEKSDTLKILLQRDVINLETSLCPKVENLKLNRDITICELHAVRCPKRQGSRHCATKKAKLFYQWLTIESLFRKINSISPSSEFVSKFDSLQLNNG